MRVIVLTMLLLMYLGDATPLGPDMVPPPVSYRHWPGVVGEQQSHGLLACVAGESLLALRREKACDSESSRENVWMNDTVLVGLPQIKDKHD